MHVPFFTSLVCRDIHKIILFLQIAMSVQQVHITVISSVLTLLVPTPALVTVDSHLTLMDNHVLVCICIMCIQLKIT